MKPKTTSISCAVIGEGNLLLCCLKDILAQNVEVKAAFSNTESAGKLCSESDVPFYKRNADLSTILRETPVDYLFSISNPRILKEDVLSLPNKLTINYHDSPLPAYAGVHASSWAIINGEKQHGISWHVVETGIDTGDILKSETVDILKEDSALTLNLKCVEAAKHSFRLLLSDILQGNVRKRKQNKNGRSYYGLYAIPQNLGVLRFTENATDVYNLARGLELGNHENSLGSPKIKTASGEYFLVTSVAMCESSLQNIDAEPGVILATVDDTILVATPDKPIQLSLSNLDGSTIQIGSYREHCLMVGRKLDNNFDINTDGLLPIRKREAFWRRQMAKYEPTMFYRQKMNVVAGIIDVSHDMNIKMIEIDLPELTTMSICGDMQACFIAFLARINCSQDVHVGLLADKRDLVDDCCDMYANITPGVFSVDQTQDVVEVLEKCTNEIKAYKEARTFLIDMFYRYPELRGMKRSPHHNLVIGSATSNCMTDGRMVNSVLRDSNVLILFTGSSKAKILYNERPAQDFGHVIDVLQHFTTFLNTIDRSKDAMQLKYISMVSENEMNAFYQRPELSTTIETKDESISNLVETQCRLTPLSIAMKTTKHFITYNKMFDEIGKLSSQLEDFVNANTTHKDVVALHLPNSVAYIVSLLAVLKCKNAFLPLPMDLPADRLVFTLKDANIQQMIMLRKDYDQLDMNGLTQYMRVVLNHQIADEEIILVEFGKERGNMLANGNNNAKGDRAWTGNHDGDFAYIMYTSGSTGRPKGVKVKESSVINLARAQVTEWDLGPGDVIAQFASVGFDASVSEILTSILSGGTLAILSTDERLGSNFVSVMNKMKVSVITLPPSALNIYSPGDLPTLRKVVSAGEACTLNISMKWTSNPHVRFFNAYGPTEGTVCATCYEYLPGTIYEDVNRDIPIGKAIDGVNVYLFDDFMNPVPPDVVGELYIGGKGLAHGYIGHAARLTDQKFVQNPLVKERSLLYKTGDHAFFDTDGNITYIGRTDDQVKIRGHRVDLSEIEQVLIQHPKIEMAVVVIHKCQQNNEMSIAAFVAPTFIYISELREYLTKVLPKYMVPTYIKKLEITDLPKTINGKVNRKELEKDESIHEIVKVNGHSHLNEIQLLIAKLWCTVFKFDESFVYSLHRNSSFSEFGGNSLQLVLIMRMIEDELNIPISFTDIGTADTLEEFAEVIKRSQDIKKKGKHCDLKSKDELRELIFHDSELSSDFFPHPDRRRSVQFTHYTTQIHRYPSKNHPKNILISGVTGFLGAFLLHEVLEQSNAHICCMVRETTETRGMGRIIDNMRKYGLWKFEYSSRIAVVISDLSQKNMGIAPDIYKSLCNAIDVVFMNAAKMNFNTAYEDHRIENVEGTKEFIRFATTGVQKYLFTTSSLSVFLFPPSTRGNTSCRRIISESEFFDDPLLIEGGYGQSKWASERLVMQALDFLPGGAIFRPARISGRSTDGVASKNDLFASTMIGMSKMGSYPDMDFPYDLTPVDYCARAMVEISLKICDSETDSCEKVYHVFNPNTVPFKELFIGMNLRSLPLEEWRRELRALNEDVKELISLTPFFLSEFWDKAPVWPIFETVNTDMNISDTTKDLMKPTSELLPVYKGFFGLEDHQ